MPRTATAQYDASEHLPASWARPGDLNFFGTLASVCHVAIYAVLGTS